MCDKCNKLEVRISQCRKFLADSLDAVTRERIAQLLEDLKADLRRQAGMCRH
jgi:hypothetical protein